MPGEVFNYGRKYHRNQWTDNMNINNKRRKRNKTIKASKDYIYFRIPIKSNEATINAILKKFSCECDCK